MSNKGGWNLEIKFFLKLVAGHYLTPFFFFHTNKVRGFNGCSNCWFSLTWSTSMFFNENKRKRLHNNRVKFPEDLVGAPTWPPFLCLGAPTWRSWRHVKTENKMSLCYPRFDINYCSVWLFLVFIFSRIIIYWIGLLQLTITWYKIRHAGGQAHYYSPTGTLKQRDLNQSSLTCLCFNVPVGE